MKYFKNEPITHNELLIWNKNKTINPRTNRKIKSTSSIYKYLTKEFSKIKLSLLDVFSNEEPITLDSFYDETTKKLLVDDNEYLLWLDSQNRIMALHYSSLIGLYKNKKFIHPITLELIPENIFKQANLLNQKLNNTDEDITLDQLALQVFQHFETLNLFVDYQDFVKLNTFQLQKFTSEIKSFLEANLSQTQKIYLKYKKYFKSNHIKNILIDLQTIMNKIKSEDKIFICYLILGALVLVIPSLKEQYPFLEFSF